MDERLFLTAAGVNPDLTVLVVPVVRVCGERHPVFGNLFLTGLGFEHLRDRKNRPMADAYFAGLQAMRQRPAEQIFLSLDSYLIQYPQFFCTYGRDSLLRGEDREIVPVYDGYETVIFRPSS